jgi:hypothetical protein
MMQLRQYELMKCSAVVADKRLPHGDDSFEIVRHIQEGKGLIGRPQLEGMELVLACVHQQPTDVSKATRYLTVDLQTLEDVNAQR